MADDQQGRTDATHPRRAEGPAGRPGGRSAPTRSNRPRSVYAVLGAGVIALLALLLIIYFSSDRNTPEQPICTTVDATTAREAVLQGRIKRITMAYDDTAQPPSAATWGPVLARLDYTDGQCANLPQGIVSQDDIYLIVGTIKVFNDITENQQIEIRYDRKTTLDPALFSTPTPQPTNTPEVTPTPPPTATPAPTAPVIVPPPGTPEATPEVTPEPTATPSPTPTREASPVATPQSPQTATLPLGL